MDTLMKHGIKIPYSLVIKYSVNPEVDKEVVEFLEQFGKISKVKTIKEPDCAFHNMIIVEFSSGTALVELEQTLTLPHCYDCSIEDVSVDIHELSDVCSELEGKLKTQSYLRDLQNVSKVTGQDFASVLKGVMSLLGQSIAELSPTPSDKPSPDVTEPDPAPSRSDAAERDVKQETQHGQPEPSSQHGATPRLSLPELNPPGIQRYVVEHIVKSEDSAAHLSSQRLRSFSGRMPRPQHEADFETWRSGVDILLQDPAVSDLQRSRKILESLFPPAADLIKHLKPETPPKVYLQILDSAYGTVQDGDELYAKFMEMFQDHGEKPSAYLQRLQNALTLALKRGGVVAADLNRHLLNQFCRGCWDNTLISELQLKQQKSHPPTFSDFLRLLRTEEDREATKAQRMKQHLGSKARAGAHAQYACTTPEETSKVDQLTTITQQLAQQLADIQRQLASLTAVQSSHRKPTHVPKLRDDPKTKPSRSSHKSTSVGPKPGYCYNCGEDGHIRPHCDNASNPSLVALKKKQFTEGQKKSQYKPQNRTSLN